MNTHEEEDVRVLPCEHCGSEGRIYRGHPNDPNPTDCGECPFCEGTGGELISVEPITMDDLCAADGCQYAKDVGAAPYHSCVGGCQYAAIARATTDAAGEKAGLTQPSEARTPPSLPPPGGEGAGTLGDAGKKARDEKADGP